MTTELRPSYCRICPALCGILVETDEARSRVVRVHGDPDHPISQGFLCPKGRALPDEHNDPNRATTSLRASPRGDFHAIASAQAMDEIADRVARILETHGPRAAGVYVGTRGYEVLQLTAATAFLRGIESPSFYSTYTIDQPGKDLARALHGSWPAGFQDAASSDVVMFVGTNPLVSATAAYIGLPVANARAELREARANGMKVIVIDPRRSETAAWADIHLQPRAGEDASVLAALVRVIIDEGLYDKEFVRRYTSGLERLRSLVDVFTPEAVERRAGVPARSVVDAARIFAAGPRGCAIGGTGINMGPNPILTEYLLLCLNSLCGRYMRPGDRVTNPGVLTKGHSTRAGVRGPRQIWGKGPEPRVRGLASLYDQLPSSALADEILTEGDGQLRALIVSGGNPLVALPNTAKVRRAFEALELLVVLDVRLTQTAQLADYVIACKLSLEKHDATLASDLRFPKAFAQFTEPMINPEADVIEEWEFFAGLARRLGTPWDLSARVGMPIPIEVDASNGAPIDDETTSEDLWELLCAGGRVTLEEVRAFPHGYVPPPDTEPVIVIDDSGDTDDRLELADDLMASELMEVASQLQLADSEFPFRLISRRMWRFYNSWGQHLGRLRPEGAANPAFLHPDDMRDLGVGDGQSIEIVSATGSIVGHALGAPDIGRGCVSMAHGWGEDSTVDDHPTRVADQGACTSRLVDDVEDISKIVGMPRQSAIPVRIAGLERSE